jgi:hypothetical protein
MGVDIHTIRLLKLARKLGVDLSCVLTVGRQALFLSDQEWAEVASARADVAQLKGDGFCEPVLRSLFGATRVDSIDASPYEGASMVHDMNLKLDIEPVYSTVLDLGCLEHIFNVPMAVDNMVGACRPGGHIIHVVPANNYCGHGFYQFSPEFFFSLYSEARGFGDTRVFLLESRNSGTSNPPEATWYRVRPTVQLKRRVEVINRERTLVVAMTKKTAEAKSAVHFPVQQSDYAAQWAATPAAAVPTAAAAAGGVRRRSAARTRLSRIAGHARDSLRTVRHKLVGYRERLHGGRADLVEMDILKEIA